MFCIKFYFLKKLIIFLTNQSCFSKLYFELWDDKESRKKAVVVMYKVMQTEHCENTLRIKASECINNESLDRRWCMCTSRLHKSIFSNNYCKDILSVFWGIHI